LILHTPTGNIINYIEDEKYGIRLFWQPHLKEGEDVDPEKAVFLPLGYDEFFGGETDKKKKSILLRIILAIGNACKPWFDKLDKWTEEQKKIKEEEKKEIEEDLDLLEAEIELEEAVEDMERLLREREKEELKKAEMGLLDEDEEDGDDDMASVPKQDEEAHATVEEEAPAKVEEEAPAKVEEEAPAEVEEEDDDEEDDGDDEDEDNSAQSSFGSVEQGQTTDPRKGKPGKSPFSTLSLAFACSSLISTVSYSQILINASICA